MAGGNGSGFIEKDTLEVRAEALTICSAGTAERSGDSDRLEIGNTAALDVVAGQESLDVGKLLKERIGGSASTQASRLKTTVKGRLKVSGRAETTLLGGAMADTQAGAVLVAAGMSDDLVIGGGARATVPVDIWLAGLIGMEEKVGTAAADGVLMECYRTLFEREYGPGSHVAGTAVFSGALHVTAKAGFRPMIKALRGIRNLTPGGGGGSASPPATPPATPPPAPPGTAATGLLGTFRSISDTEDAHDLPRFSERFTHTEDLADATETASVRDARSASWLEDLQVLRRASEQDDPEAAEAVLRRLRGDDAVAARRPTYTDFNARYYLSMDAEGGYMLLEDPGGPYRFAEAPDGSRRVVQDPQAEFTGAKDLSRYDIEASPGGRYRLVDPNASDSDPVRWLHSAGLGEHADDTGYSSRIASDAPQRLDYPADPGHAQIRDLLPEPAPLGGPAVDSRSGPIATIETVDQRSYVVAAEGGDLTRHPIGPPSGTDETGLGQVDAVVVQDPPTNRGGTTPLTAPAGDDSPRFLLDIEVEQIDLEHIDDAQDLPSPRRLSDSAGEDASPGMQFGDRGAGWEEPDLPPGHPDAPDVNAGHDTSTSAEIRHGLPDEPTSQPSEPPAVSRFHGGDESVAAPTPTTPASGQGAGHRLSARTDTTGAIQRLGQEIALQTEEIRRVRDSGGSADDLRHMEAEREARQLALSEMQAGRDPRPALRTQAAEAREPYRTNAFTDLVDFFGGAGQFSPQGTSPRTGGLHGRIPSALDTSGLIAGWRTQVGAVTDTVDVLNPRTAAEIEQAEALSDAELWMGRAVVLVANRQDPSDVLLRQASDLEARTFADGTTAAGEASMLRAMAKEYQDLLEEFLAMFPVAPLQLDEVTPPRAAPQSVDLDAGIGRPGRSVPVEGVDIRNAGDPGTIAVGPSPLDGNGDAELENARHHSDDIYDAFSASAPGRDTPAADPGSDLAPHLIQEDYWGMAQDLLPPAPNSGGDVAPATDPVRIPKRGERGESTSDSHHILDGMEAGFDDNARTPSPSSDRYRLSTENVNNATDVRIGTDDQAVDAIRLPGMEDLQEYFGISDIPQGSTTAPTARRKGGKVR